MAKKKETVSDDKKLAIAEFFKANPQAKSVIVVGDQLFLGSHFGAAKEFATRTSQKWEEFENPNLATDAATTEVEEAEN